MQTLKIIVILLLFLSLTLPADSQDDSGQQKPNAPSASLPCPGAFKIDPSYIMVTEETGGQIYMLDPSEIEKATPIMTKSLNQIDDTILRIYGEMKNGRKEFVVPVDSSVEILTFSAFIQCLKSITILNPSGIEESSGPQIEETNYRAGRFVRVNTPAPGDWRIRISGTGYYSVIADAKSDIQLTAVEFVEEGGRPGHEGYFKIKVNPKADVPQMLSATLYGKVSTVQFALIKMDGSAVRLHLDQVAGTQDPAEYLGSVTLPAEPFRIIAEGIDSAGLIYRRFYPPVFHTAN